MQAGVGETERKRRLCASLVVEHDFQRQEGFASLATNDAQSEGNTQDTINPVKRQF